MTVKVQSESFDPGQLLAKLCDDNSSCGAVASFVGLVRRGSEDVLAMTLQHYPGMTERQLLAFEAEACRRWPVERLVILHRFGRLLPGEPIVFVGVTAAHRDVAFQACEFLVDRLKTRAPFWKQEETATGSHWVEALPDDDIRAERWD